MTFHGSCTNESRRNCFSISLCATTPLSYVRPDASTPDVCAVHTCGCSLEKRQRPEPPSGEKLQPFFGARRIEVPQILCSAGGHVNTRFRCRCVCQEPFHEQAQRPRKGQKELAQTSQSVVWAFCFRDTISTHYERAWVPPTSCHSCCCHLRATS